MGFSFSNIQIRRQNGMNVSVADEIAELIAAGRGWERIDQQEEADVSTAIVFDESCAWISVVSDAFDADPEEQIRLASAISERLHSDALAIGCFDSDYLFLNMVNPEKKVDLWASTGSAAAVGISGMRRSNFKAWKNRVLDEDAFKTIMKRQRAFAEEVLNDLEALLDLPARKSIGGGEEWEDLPGVLRYFYKAQKSEENGEPPVLEWDRMPSYAPREGEESMISAVNRGGASRGLGIAFTGKSVEEGGVAVYSACIQVHDRRGEWEFHPVEIEETMRSDGKKMLYGELPSLPIPEKVSDKLPWKKKMDLEYMRCLVLKYTPESLHAWNEGELLDDLCVHLIPLKNWSGQCGWIGRPMDKDYR